MKNGHRITAWVTALWVALAASAWSVTAWAEREADVVVLLTEVVESGVVGDQQEVNYWWSHAEEPQWTAFDEIVFDSLRQAGVVPVTPESIDISRIYRRPGLSTDNAAQLGRLLDGDRVLVGEVQYRRLRPVAPLGYQGVEVRAVVQLVPAGDSEGVSLQRFTVTRQVYGEHSETLLDQARQAAGSALGEVMGQSMRRAGGEVGSRSHDRLLALRNVERADNLERIRQRLLSIDEVERVVERWASEGLIALEILGSEGESGVADYAYRVLASHEFEDFELVRNDGSAIEGVTEFWLEPRQPSF